MVRHSSSRLVIAALAIGMLSACASESPAEKPAETPTDSAGAPSTDLAAVVKERQDNFKGIADSFKAVRGELEKDTPDFALIATKATDINTRAGKLGGYFPVGTSVDDGFDTEALPAIWEKPEAVGAAVKKLVDESAKLASLAPGGDKAALAAQAMALGGACKGCHDRFRLDDEK